MKLYAVDWPGARLDDRLRYTEGTFATPAMPRLELHSLRAGRCMHGDARRQMPLSRVASIIVRLATPESGDWAAARCARRLPQYDVSQHSVQ
jgi:hypothetical protein